MVGTPFPVSREGVEAPEPRTACRCDVRRIARAVIVFMESEARELCLDTHTPSAKHPKRGMLDQALWRVEDVLDDTYIFGYCRECEPEKERGL